MREQCEWCEADATIEIIVPATTEEGEPYRRTACPAHEGKTKRLVELDHCTRFSELGAEIHRLEADGNG